MERIRDADWVELRAVEDDERRLRAYLDAGRDCEGTTGT
jgi:hypothetical protein